MKKYILIISTTLIALLFSACGGGGGSGDSASFKDAQTLIQIVDCNTSTYTTIVDRDVLVKDSDNTNITVVHDNTNSKKVCVNSGAAHLVRQ